MRLVDDSDSKIREAGGTTLAATANASRQGSFYDLAPAKGPCSTDMLFASVVM